MCKSVRETASSPALTISLKSEELARSWVPWEQETICGAEAPFWSKSQATEFKLTPDSSEASWTMGARVCSFRVGEKVQSEQS